MPGPTGVTGATGLAPEEAFASFANFGLQYINNTQLPFGEIVSDATGQITLSDTRYISLAPGYYLISFHVSAILRTAGYMQITPYYNDMVHLELGIYFKTSGDQASAYGSNSIITFVPATTRFSLTYNSNVQSTDGAATLTVLRLNREV